LVRNNLLNKKVNIAEIGLGCQNREILPGPKIIKLKLETNLKSQTSDWLKWRLVAILANQMLEILDWSPISVL
jgi:hypothetical protein